MSRITGKTHTIPLLDDLEDRMAQAATAERRLRRLAAALGLGALALALGLATCAPAFAQAAPPPPPPPPPPDGPAASCLDRDLVLQALARGYDEAPLARGLTLGGNMLEVIAAPDGATWSVILTTPEGCTYAMAAGLYWSDLTPAGML